MRRPPATSRQPQRHPRLRARERLPPRISAGVPDASREVAQASVLAVVVHDHSADVLLIPSQLPTVEVLRRPLEFTQYLSIRYTERLAEAGAVASVGSKGDSYDNALAETINGLYKTEVIRRKGLWRSIEDVEFATLGWVHWFNNERLLEPIGDIPPAEFEGLYWLEREANDRVGLNESSLH